MSENNEMLHLPVNPGFHWAKINENTGLKEFFACVDSGYYKREDYELIEDSEMNAYINEFYPKREFTEVEEPIYDSSVTLDSSLDSSIQ